MCWATAKDAVPHTVHYTLSQFQKVVIVIIIIINACIEYANTEM